MCELRQARRGFRNYRRLFVFEGRTGCLANSSATCSQGGERMRCGYGVEEVVCDVVKIEGRKESGWRRSFEKVDQDA